MTKTEVRERARELGLANADKPESQEICFVPDGDYARFVERRAAHEALRPGRVVDRGRPRACRPTRECIVSPSDSAADSELPAATPLYVREIRPDRGEVVVGPRDALRSAALSRAR